MNSNFTRRRFLKTVVVSAGAVGAGGLIGCGSESSDHNGGVSFSSVDGGIVFPQSVASGDPKAGSIILWTRLGTSSSSDQSVTVQVASDSSFSGIVAQTSLTSSSSSDHCLKVKVTDLNTATTYYYRFITSDTSSRTGRFKTAAKGNVDTPVKFGFISCQDYVNGYYNTLLKFLEQDQLDSVDFIVHLGDYIYETTGDPSFQANVRPITFTDQDGALPLPNATSTTHYAAQSLSNYRQLYKTYRGDSILQQVHEKFAFINIWDDHEFSDDSWQDNATYTDGKSDEQNTTRKENSEQAFFEYTPIDIVPNTGSPEASGQISVDREDLYQSIISRQFRFGSNLNLMMTDFRTFRPDHLIAEDAFPGSVVVNEAGLGGTLLTLVSLSSIAYCDPTAPDPLGNSNDGLVAAYQAVAAITDPATQAATLTATTHSVAPGLGLPQYIDIHDIAGDTNTTVMINQVATPVPIAAYLGFLNSFLPSAYAAELGIAPTDQSIVDRVAAIIGDGTSSVLIDTTTINAFLSVAGVINNLNPNFTTTGFPTLSDPVNAAANPASPTNINGYTVSDSALEYGISYSFLGKQDLFAANGIGARYNVVKNTYDLYTAYLSAVAGNTSYDNAWGDAQQTSILINLTVSNATWNVLGSSTSFTSMVLDASTDSCTGQDSALRQTLDGNMLSDAMPNAKFYLNVDQWDGFPFRRTVLMDDPTGAIGANNLKTLKGADTIIISGDIHATFATDHGANTDGNRAIEFTTPAVSSGNFGSFVTGAVATIVDAATGDDGVDAVDIGTAAALTASLTAFMKEGNANINYNNNAVNGVATVSVTSTTLTTTFHHIATGVMPGSVAAQDPTSDFFNNLVTSHYDDPTALTWTTREFQVTKTDGKNGVLTDTTTT